MTNLNTPEDKLNWIFTAFDTDGGGSIDVDEIKWEDANEDEKDNKNE